MPAISSKPTYPVPKERAVLTLTSLNASTNYVKVFALMAPKKSEIYSRLNSRKQDRVRVHEGDTSQQWSFIPDVGGVYTFTLEEYSITSPTLAAFQDDTGGAPSPAALASSTVTLYVGEKLKHKLGTTQDSADLEVFVWNNTIRETTIGAHGVATPAIRNWSSKTAEAATEDTNVEAALAALIDVTATAAVGDVAAVVADLFTKFASHRGSVAMHNAADTVNDPGDGYVATSPKATESALNNFQRYYLAHIRDEGVATGGTNPHNYVDGANIPVISGASTEPASQLSSLASMWVAYKEHNEDASVHNTSDPTKAPDSLPPLLELHRRFFEAIADQTPTAPDGTNQATTTLAQLAGFKDA